MVSKALVTAAYHNKLRELADLGVDLHLIVPPSWGGQTLEVEKGDGYEIYPTRIILSGRNHFHVYRNLYETMKRIKPDVVHIDEEHYSIVTYQVMRLSNRIGSRSLFFTWQNIYKKYPFPFSKIEKYNLDNADFAIAGNKEAKAVLKRKGYQKEIAIIPQFGVDHEFFCKMETSVIREKLNIKKDRFVIGFIGRLVEEKGILDLIGAISRLKDDVILLLIGSGPLRRKIIHKAKKLGIEDRVKIIGQVPSLEIPQYMNSLSCLVLPSLTRSNWKEQFGRVLIEAMSCEVPVIGSSSGEIPNLIGDAGMIFQEGEIDDLIGKLNLLLHDHETRKSMGEKGRKMVLKNYTQKKIAEETFSVYQRMLSH
ncbi:MAG: glycosyltransferase family 4 protein [Deltaproteobacteria bacterium]|nr:glycosyltransferase family 4 protein [Deltaproteobacteria bacterium]